MVETLRAVRERTGVCPRLGIVLGSGMGGLAEAAENPEIIPYDQLPGFMPSTAPGHAGRLVFGFLEGLACVLMQGRLHGYEGYEARQIAYPIRVMAALGIERLLLTNAAGGVNLSFRPGDLMVIDDHINLSRQNPLTGPHDLSGPRFPDMTYAYDAGMRSLIGSVARELCVPLRHGVYAMMDGPSFETPAEIRMLRTLGADAVGMSTVPEVIAANHCGLPVAAISCITNMAAGILPQPLNYREVIETGERVREKFLLVIRGVVREIAKSINSNN